MDQDDERDYAEEAANQSLLDEERAEAATMLIPNEAPTLTKAIIDTAARHNLPLSFLNFTPSDVTIMSRPNPTAEQGRAFLVDLLGEAVTIDDSSSPRRKNEKPWRVLTADFADILSPAAGFDHYQIIIWVQVDGEERV